MIAKISKKIYDIDEPIVIYFDAFIPYVDISNFELWEVEGADYVSVPISVSLSTTTITGAVATGGDTATIVPHRNLNHNKIHVLVTSSVISDEYEILLVDVKRFLVFDTSVERNYNDVYYQLRNIDSILSLDSVINKDNNYDFDIYPTTYDPINKIYNQSTTPINVQNTDFVIENYINQYFKDFAGLFYNLRDREFIASNPNNIVDLSVYDDEYINHLNSIIMKNITRYTALKGNKYLMEFVLGLYTKIFGYNLISVVEDRSHNFIYRVSTSLPKSLWNRHIKPIVHPIGWSDIFNEITSNVDGITGDITFLDPKERVNRQYRWVVDTDSYIDAEWYSQPEADKPHYQKLKSLFHLQGNIDYLNAETHTISGHDFCVFNHYFGESKFNLKIGASTNAFNYGSSGLEREVHDLQNHSIKYESIDRKVRLKYKSSGIATTYIWTKYIGSTVLEEYHTYHNFVDITLNKDEYVVLTLKRGDWQETVFRYDLLLFVDYLTMRDSWGWRVGHNDGATINASEPTNSFDGISFESFTSYSNVAHISYQTDFDYTFETSAGSAAFLAEFDTPTSLSSTVSDYVFNGETYKSIDVEYVPIGIGTKYHWSLYNNGVLQEEKDTYHNTANFKVDDIDLPNIDIYLTLYYKNGSHVMTNYLTF